LVASVLGKIMPVTPPVFLLTGAIAIKSTAWRGQRLRGTKKARNALLINGSTDRDRLGA